KELAAVQNRVATARGEANQARFDLARKDTEIQEARQSKQPNVRELEAQRQIINNTLKAAEFIEQQGPADITRAQANVAAKREAEARTLEAWQVRELEERRYRENQFRVEVAAAKEDPDTYGPADPLSVDPVLRVSISVIGEGLIQLRGPIKGLNAIRTMIKQIDAAVGQGRIGVHTLQLNGEHGSPTHKSAPT